MPAVERMGGKWLRGFIRQRLLCGRVKWRPAVLALWLVLVCAVVVVVLAAVNGGISRGCPGLVPTHCATQPLFPQR
jgi:hypothetical protein